MLTGRTLLSVPLFYSLFSILFYSLFCSSIPIFPICLVFSLFFLLFYFIFLFYFITCQPIGAPLRRVVAPIRYRARPPVQSAPPLHAPQAHPYRIGPAHSLNTPFSLFLSTLQLDSLQLNSSQLDSSHLTSSSLTYSLYSFNPTRTVSLSLHSDSSLYIIHRSIHLAPHLSITIQQLRFCLLSLLVSCTFFALSPATATASATTAISVPATATACLSTCLRPIAPCQLRLIR